MAFVETAVAPCLQHHLRCNLRARVGAGVSLGPCAARQRPRPRAGRLLSGALGLRHSRAGRASSRLLFQSRWFVLGAYRSRVIENYLVKPHMHVHAPRRELPGVELPLSIGGRVHVSQCCAF